MSSAALTGGAGSPKPALVHPTAPGRLRPSEPRRFLPVKRRPTVAVDVGEGEGVEVGV